MIDMNYFCKFLTMAHFKENNKANTFSHPFKCKVSILNVNRIWNVPLVVLKRRTIIHFKLKVVNPGELETRTMVVANNRSVVTRRLQCLLLYCRRYRLWSSVIVCSPALCYPVQCANTQQQGFYWLLDCFTPPLTECPHVTWLIKLLSQYRWTTPTISQMENNTIPTISQICHLLCILCLVHQARTVNANRHGEMMSGFASSQVQSRLQAILWLILPPLSGGSSAVQCQPSLGIME